MFPVVLSLRTRCHLFVDKFMFTNLCVRIDCLSMCVTMITRKQILCVNESTVLPIVAY